MIPERASVSALFDDFELMELARLKPVSADDLCAKVIEATFPQLSEKHVMWQALKEAFSKGLISIPKPLHTFDGE